MSIRIFGAIPQTPEKNRQRVHIPADLIIDEITTHKIRHSTADLKNGSLAVLFI
jgi:hypothetical protein